MRLSEVKINVGPKRFLAILIRLVVLKRSLTGDHHFVFRVFFDKAPGKIIVVIFVFYIQFSLIAIMPACRNARGACGNNRQGFVPVGR